MRIGFATGLLLAVAAAQAQVQYHARQLEVDGQKFGMGSINEHGVIAGTVTVNGEQRGYLYEPGYGFTRIPVPRLHYPYNASPRVVNNNGVVIGDDGTWAWKWSRMGGFHWLGTVLSSPNYWHQPRGFNDHEVGVGTFSHILSGQFLTSVGWDPTGAIGNLGDDVIAQNINNAGRIVGTYIGYRGFYWDEGGSPQLLPGFDGWVMDVNELGTMVGSSRESENSDSRVTIWGADGSLVRRLGVQQGGIHTNDNGTVLWIERGDGTRYNRAVYWSALTGTRTLESLLDAESAALGLEIDSSYGLNNAGQIIAYGRRPGEQFGSSYLLEPVPEPATLAALTLGTLALLRRRRHANPRWPAHVAL